MTMRLPIFAAVCLACALPLSAGAEPQGPRKGGERPPGEHERMERFGKGGEPGNKQDWEQTRRDFEEFCKQHARNRWKEIEKQKSGPRPRMMSMMQKFRVLQSLEREDKELYAIRVRQIEVEDAEFGLLTELKKSDKSDKQAAEKIKGDLRVNAKQYVDLRLQERGRRIERLSKFLEKEKEALAADQQAQDRLIDERVREMLAEGPDFFNPKPLKREPDGTPVVGPGATTNASQIKP